jgi:hypothetical protein
MAALLVLLTVAFFLHIYHLDVGISGQEGEKTLDEVVARDKVKVLAVSDSRHEQLTKALASDFDTPYLVNPYLLGLGMLLIVFHCLVESRLMDEIAAAVH